jgi:zinc transport system permease protein
MSTILSPLYALLTHLLPFPWAQPLFMQRALLATLMLTPMCAGMGVLVVSHRMAFFSDAISHSAFTGVALGLLLGIDPRLSLVLFGLVVGLAITRMKRGSPLSTDTVISVFFSAAVALGVVLISARRGLTRNLQSFLYGDVLAVSDGELLLYLALFVFVALFLAWAYNRLMLIGVNERFAATRGINNAAYEYTFALLLSLVVTMSIRAVGLLLVTALLVVPAATARNLARSAGGMFWFAIIASLLSGIGGLIA